jgi:hypothetical protein
MWLVYSTSGVYCIIVLLFVLLCVCPYSAQCERVSTINVSKNEIILVLLVLTIKLHMHPTLTRASIESSARLCRLRDSQWRRRNE